MIKLGLRHEPACISPNGITISNAGRIIFEGHGILGNGSALIVKHGGVLILGENFGMTGETKIHCQQSIVIGRNFSCSWQVEISDTDLHQLYDTDTCQSKPLSCPIVIGSEVWCCQHVMIGKGSVIPSWTTVAAYSLTNKAYNLPPYSILAGYPAKAMKTHIRRDDMYEISLKKDWVITKGLKAFG